MRRLLFYLLVFVVIPVSGFSQVFSLGIIGKGGISQVIYSSNLENTPGITVNSEYRIAYNGGIFAKYRISNSSSIGAELLFTQQNGLIRHNTDMLDTINGIHIIGTEKDYLHVSYLSLPLYYTLSGANISAHLGVQGNWSIQEGGKTVSDFTLNGLPEHSEVTYDTLGFKNFDFGPVAGIRYNITEKLFAGLDYYLGLLNLVKDESTLVSVQNQNVMICVGFRILRVDKTENKIYQN